MPNRQMTGRRVLLRRALAMPLALGLSVLGGCGWEPLYADRETGPADAELRAIHVVLIPERIGQQLVMALRQSFNTTGEATPQRYTLKITLQVSQSSLGVQSQGLGTRGRLDIVGNFVLSDIKSGSQLLSGLSHVAESFDIQPNEYVTVVAQKDAITRAVEEMRRDIVARLTLFLQRRAAERAALPVMPKPGTR